jgi:hypothetical protein
MASCKKDLNQGLNPQSEIASSINTGLLTTAVPTLCSPTTVSLCAGKTQSIGTVTVGTGLDNKIYVIYTVTGAWRLKDLHLYVGSDAGIPVSGGGNAVPGQFPYAVSFPAPYLVQTYAFAVTTPLDAMTIAAHAAVVRVNLAGVVVESQTAWGDGCSGVKINQSGNGSWGTKFTYNRGTCRIEAATVICSQAVPYFFGEGSMVWPDVNGEIEGNVTVATFNYTEAEGNDIYNTPDVNGVAPDAKSAFLQVCTMKLSYTNYLMDAGVSAAVLTIETWLVTVGKLSPTNLPAGSQAVRNATDYLTSWIATHNCGIR